tara:strand:- start:1271 stop:2383 length:1113 start_codon:yes stop_codon:yes gene_type:complete
MNKNICYVTYQTFPASTANSLQTILNIKYFIKNNCYVSLIYPIREKMSSNSLQEVQDYYDISENINIENIEHNYPFGRINIFKGLMFHISHFLWARKTVKLIDKEAYDFFITRSDWIFYYLLKNTNKNVIFECHKTSKLRKFLLNKSLKKNNAKIIYLNKNLKDTFSKINNKNNSIVLHNGVDLEKFNFSEVKNNDVIFVGNLQRYSRSRNLSFVVDGFVKSKLSDFFSLTVIGGPDEKSDLLKAYVEKNYIDKDINIYGQLSRREAIKYMNKASIGILINDSKDEHSFLHTSPLKYFEYLGANLNVVASNLPAHKELPYSENIQFYDQNDVLSFSRALEEAVYSKSTEINLEEISLDHRIKSILKFVNS